MAFVLLAYSWAYRAGISEAAEYIQDSLQLMEKHFWDADAGLYKDEANGDFSVGVYEYNFTHSKAVYRTLKSLTY